MESPVEFLTVEECHQVDAALLTSREKFTSRVAIYALRSLKTIATQQNCTIKSLSQEIISDWIHSDPSLQETQDGNFRGFFSQIVLGAIRPLQAIANDGGNDGAIENVTVAQVISHYEAQAKVSL
jgi:hypothetical protein